MTPQLMSQLKEVLKAKESGLMAEFRKARERLNVRLITDRFVGDRIDEARIFAERDLVARHINFNWALLRQDESGEGEAATVRTSPAAASVQPRGCHSGGTESRSSIV